MFIFQTLKNSAILTSTTQTTNTTVSSHSSTLYRVRDSTLFALFPKGLRRVSFVGLKALEAQLPSA